MRLASIKLYVLICNRSFLLAFYCGVNILVMCVVCLGYGAYIALPLIRKAVEDAKPRGGITQQEAVDLLEKCLEVIMGNIKYLLLLS